MSLILYHFTPPHPWLWKKKKTNKPQTKTKNKAIHVYIFNDGSQNDKEIEAVDQSTVQTLRHSGL